MNSAWAEEEAASMDLGDERLDERATILLSALGNHPQLSIPAACGGHAETQAAYRFFDNPKVTFEDVLAPHVQKTMQRMAQEAVVLLVQDTSEIDLTRPKQQVRGAGELDGARQGIALHVMHAFTAAGTPLGTLWSDIVNRVEGVSHAPATRKARQRKHRPIEEKESLRWLSGLRQARRGRGVAADVLCLRGRQRGGHL